MEPQSYITVPNIVTRHAEFIREMFIDNWQYLERYQCETKIAGVLYEIYNRGREDYIAKQTALAKLTPAERELLGLK